VTALAAPQLPSGAWPCQGCSKTLRASDRQVVLPEGGALCMQCERKEEIDAVFGGVCPECGGDLWTWKPGAARCTGGAFSGGRGCGFEIGG
jgi:hypothetical protein